MSGRHTKELRVRYIGDPDLAKAFLPEARKHVATVDQQRQGIGPGASLARRIAGANGVVYRVVLVGNSPLVEIDVRKAELGDMEEIIHCYISSADGLRVLDLGEKRQVAHLTGLSAFEVDNVSPDGAVVHMTGGGLVVRVDVPAIAAIGNSLYPSQWWNGSSYSLGRATPAITSVSPDQTRGVSLFSNTYNPATGGVVEGLGGALTVDTDTLLPLRSAIRTAPEDPDQRTNITWAPDSQRYFLPVKLNTETDGLPPHDPNVQTIPTEYIAAFSRDGVMLETLLLYMWPTGPAPGFFTALTSVACSPDGKRLYVAVQPHTAFDPSPGGIRVIDLSGTSMAILGVIPGVSGVRPRSMSITHDGSRLVMRQLGATTSENSIVVVTVKDDSGADVFDQVEVFQGSEAYDTLGLKQGPKSRIGQPPDSRWFGLHTQAGVTALKGYRQFDAPAVYDFDITEYAVKQRFAFAAVGTRPKRKTA